MKKSVYLLSLVLFGTIQACGTLIPASTSKEVLGVDSGRPPFTMNKDKNGNEYAITNIRMDLYSMTYLVVSSINPIQAWDWRQAYDGCKKLNWAGLHWRIPTKQEGLEIAKLGYIGKTSPDFLRKKYEQTNKMWVYDGDQSEYGTDTGNPNSGFGIVYTDQIPSASVDLATNSSESVGYGNVVCVTYYEYAQDWNAPVPDTFAGLPSDYQLDLAARIYLRNTLRTEEPQSFAYLDMLEKLDKAEVRKRGAAHNLQLVKRSEKNNGTNRNKAYYVKEYDDAIANYRNIESQWLQMRAKYKPQAKLAVLKAFEKYLSIRNSNLQKEEERNVKVSFTYSYWTLAEMQNIMESDIR